MKLSRKVGATSEIWQIFLSDSSSTTGAGLTGLTNASSSLTAYYHRDTDTTATAISLVTMTVGTFTSSGFKEIDGTNLPGFYQFCPPNAALASGAKSCVFLLKGATNLAPLPIEVDLDSQVDVTHWNGTAVATPNTAGYPLVDTAKFAGQTITCSGGVTIPAATLASTTNITAGTITSASNCTITSNTDKTGYSLSQSFPTNFSSFSIDSNGRIDVIKIAGTTQTARDIGTSVLLSSGTGTGQLDFTSGVVKANATQFAGQTITCSGGVTVPAATLASTTNITAGTITTVTTVTNQLTAAQIATGIWQDTTAGDFTTALSIGKSVLNGVSLGTGLTINAYTGNTVQTGDAYAKVNDGTIGLAAIKGYVDDIGVAGAGLTALGDSRIANLDATVTSRMASYTQPTGFLAATFPNGTIANTTNITAGIITTVTTVTNQLTAAQIATGIWQDTTAGDFTTVSSIGKSLYTSGAAPGTANGLLVAGSNAATTFSSVTCTNNFTVSGNWLTTGTTTWTAAATFTNGLTSNITGNLVGTVSTLTTYTGNTPQTGDAYARIGAAGAGLTALGDTRIANLDAAITTRMASYTQPTGFLAATFPGGTIANTTNITAGTITTVTTVTNQLTAAQIATGVWQDTTAGDFTTALSIGKSVLNGVSLGTGLTINAYTGNTVQTGDAYARIGVAGVGLTNVVLPAGGLANVTNWTVAITGNLSGSVDSVIGSIGGITADGWATAFAIDSGEIYNTAIPGSLVYEIGAWVFHNGMGSGPNASIASAVWNTTRASHTDPDSFGEGVASVASTVNAQVVGMNDAVITTGVIEDNTYFSIASNVWNNSTRTLSAGTNIVLAKGTGITGFNDITGSSVTVTSNTDKTGYSLSSSQTFNVTGSISSVTGNVGGNVVGSIGSLATQAKADVNAEVDTAISDVGLTTTVTGRIDVATSTRLATSGYTAPDNTTISAIATYVDTEVAAIKTQTDKLTFNGSNEVAATFTFAQSDANLVWSSPTRTLTAFGFTIESDCAGTGTVVVNADYGGTGVLAYRDSEDVGIAGARIRAYLTSDYDAGNTSVDFIIASASTDVDGNWEHSMMLDPEDYTLIYYKQGSFGPNRKDITVT